MSAPLRRIVYLSHASVPSAEANSIQVMKMCAALARRGGEVTLYCKDAGDAARAHGGYGVAESFRIVGLRGGRTRFLSRALFSLRAFARLRHESSLELLYGRDYHTLALVALCGRPRVPLILEVHQPPGDGLQRALLRTIFASPRFLRLVVISRALAEEYERLFGALLRGRVAVAHDGADLPRGDELAPVALPGLGLGYVGNLYPGKGMEMIAQLAQRLGEFRFHVIGGQAHDIAHWQAQSAAANLVFHGHVPHAEAQQRMRACDILLAPFQREVWIGGARADISRWMSPLKIFEYMGSGRPMVASDLPVLREVLVDGENALLAPPEDVEAWVRAIRALAADEALRRRLGARAREDLDEHYTWDRRVEQVLPELGPEARRTGVARPSLVKDA